MLILFVNSVISFLQLIAKDVEVVALSNLYFCYDFLFSCCVVASLLGKKKNGGWTRSELTFCTK